MLTEQCFHGETIIQAFLTQILPTGRKLFLFFFFGEFF